jgi:hypothetical protein
VAKKVFKGWCLPENKNSVAAFSNSSGLNSKLIVEVYRRKGYKADYHPDSWPPRRVIVTVEIVED